MIRCAGALLLQTTLSRPQPTALGGVSAAWLLVRQRFSSSSSSGVARTRTDVTASASSAKLANQSNGSMSSSSAELVEDDYEDDELDDVDKKKDFDLMTPAEQDAAIAAAAMRESVHYKLRGKGGRGDERRFIDYFVLRAQGGTGGNGCSSMARDMINPKGAPDGGDGGKGGRIILVGDRHVSCYRRLRGTYVAECGKRGGTERMQGANGRDLILPVPLGTVVKELYYRRIQVDSMISPEEHSLAFQMETGVQSDGIDADGNRLDCDEEDEQYDDSEFFPNRKRKSVDLVTSDSVIDEELNTENSQSTASATKSTGRKSASSRLFTSISSTSDDLSLSQSGSSSNASNAASLSHQSQSSSTSNGPSATIRSHSLAEELEKMSSNGTEMELSMEDVMRILKEKKPKKKKTKKSERESDEIENDDETGDSLSGSTSDDIRAKQSNRSSKKVSKLKPIESLGLQLPPAKLTRSGLPYSNKPRGQKRKFFRKPPSEEVMLRDLERLSKLPADHPAHRDPVLAELYSNVYGNMHESSSSSEFSGHKISRGRKSGALSGSIRRSENQSHDSIGQTDGWQDDLETPGRKEEYETLDQHRQPQQDVQQYRGRKSKLATTSDHQQPINHEGKETDTGLFVSKESERDQNEHLTQRELSKIEKRKKLKDFLAKRKESRLSNYVDSSGRRVPKQLLVRLKEEKKRRELLYRAVFGDYESDLPSFATDMNKLGGTMNKNPTESSSTILSNSDQDSTVANTSYRTATSSRQRIEAVLERHGQFIVVADGGKGGKGNARFGTPANRVPKETTPGQGGELRILSLELKTIADVGLVGLPNAGKSSFLRAVSNAHPKVANYPFTTLNPHLGVIDFRDHFQIFTADIPGIIAGAHINRGLGLSFLRHIERARVLLYVLDASSPTLIEDFRTLQRELELYKKGMTERPSLVVANKADLADETPIDLDGLRRAAAPIKVLAVSSRYERNITAVTSHLRKLVESLREKDAAWSAHVEEPHSYIGKKKRQQMALPGYCDD